MSLDSESFLKLCRELRPLGACKVEGWGFSATFTPIATAAPQVPLSATLTAPRARKAAASRAAEPSAEELRELAYRRELGIV